MKNNNKGHAFLGLVSAKMGASAGLGMLGFKLAFMGIAAACIWHIPAWEKAKANHTEKEYQAQKMWPQQWFAKLPGGDDYKKNSAATLR